MSDGDKNTGELVKDNHNRWNWKTKEGELILVCDMADSHLRNAALFLMGMGYQKCNLGDEPRVIWLRILRTEWERRMLRRVHDLGMVRQRVK